MWTHLCKLSGKFEGGALKAEVVSWRVGQHKPKVDVDDVTFRVYQDVSIVPVGMQNETELHTYCMYMILHLW